MTCVVPGCYSRVKTDENISFHRFPADLELKKEWIKNVRRCDKWSPSLYTRICSLHFEESCYREGYARKKLHSYAVPTIFKNHPLSCQPKLPKIRKLVAKYDTTAERSWEEQVYISPPKLDRTTQTKRIDGTHIEIELRKAMKLVDKFKRLAAKRGSKLKNLQRRCSRLNKKNADLETIIDALQDKMESEHTAIMKSSLGTDNQAVYLMRFEEVSLPIEYTEEIKSVQ